MIDAAETSLRHNGAPVPLDVPSEDRRHLPDRRRNGHGAPHGRFGRRSDDVLAFSEAGAGHSNGGR
jgi:hypothetical protein